MTRSAELKKILKKEERVLKQLEKKDVAESVIQEQQKIIDKTKTELAEAEQELTEKTSIAKASQANITDNSITFCVVEGTDGINKKIRKESKKIAFVKHNRPIEKIRVDKFIQIIAQRKYESAYPIIVAEAEWVCKKGYTVVDVNGREIKEEEAADYYVILDGQHRVSAFGKLNAIGKTHEIQNVYIRNKDNIGEYLIEINNASKSWDSKDKYTVAGLISKQEAFKTISEKIGEGFNPSTVALIYLGKKINASLLNKVLKGENVELPEGMIFNKERGDKFITLCKAAGMDVKLITKRYYIEGFNSYAASIDESTAFKALENISRLEDLERKLRGVKIGDDFICILKSQSNNKNRA